MNINLSRTASFQPASFHTDFVNMEKIQAAPVRVGPHRIDQTVNILIRTDPFRTVSYPISPMGNVFRPNPITPAPFRFAS